MFADAATPPATIQAPAGGARFGFENALLGETLADWRATTVSGVTCQPATEPSAVVICAAPPVALGGRQVAHDLIFQFVGGRLARIRFLTSIDAYDRVRARLDGRFGTPERIIRDNIEIDQNFQTPHLKAYWRNGRSTILLNDPEPDGQTLSVTYSLDAWPAGMPGSAT